MLDARHVRAAYWFVPLAALAALLAGAHYPFASGHVLGAGDLPADLLAHALAHWDAGWYGTIASDGYSLKPGEQSPVAFFPAYPLAMRSLMQLGLNRWFAGPLVTFLCGIALLELFRRWARAVSPTREAAALAPWLLALYPFAFYLYGVVYSDAFFVLFAVAAFYALERGQHGTAAVLGAIATFARPAAPAIVLGLLVRSLELRRRGGEKLRVVDFVPALAGAGLLAYMIFLQVSFDDALAFAHVQGAPGWDNAPGWHSWLKVAWFKAMFPRVVPIVAVRLGGHALVTLLALALVWPTYKKLGLGYAAYVLVAVGLPALSSHDFQGLGRYVLAAFPLFLTLALLLEGRPRLRTVYLVASAVLLLTLAAGFGAGGYIA